MATRLDAPPAPPPGTPYRGGWPTPQPPPVLTPVEPSATRGLFPVSVLATLSLLVLPGATVALLVRLGGLAVSGPGGWLLTGVVSLAYMFAGARLWSRHPRSKGLSFGELVLWSWARRRRAEGTLARGADLFDAEIGELLNPQGRREQTNVLRELNAALEVRDPYTRGHSRRVERHAHRIALALRCSDDDIFDIRLAASLHDVGKIKVPDRVLRKDGPLDGDEWAIMKQHSEVGAELLARLGNHNVVAAVRSHHERWDGCGYPDGLSGTRIPLGARIIAVADTFDAITSCRPYRNRSGREHAVAVLKSEAGRQFDPAVVTAFLSTTPHQAVAFAGLFTLAAPFARKLASQWGVVFNKVGAVTMAGTMTASAFTGAATVERTQRPERTKKAAAAVTGVGKDAPQTAPAPPGKALGHEKKAHEGGNGKSRAATKAGEGPEEQGAPKESRGKALGHDKKAHEGGNGKSHAGGNGKSHGEAHASSKAKGVAKPKGKPSDPTDAPSGHAPAAPGSEAKPEPAPKPDPAPKPEPAPKPDKPEDAAPEAAEAPVAEAPTEGPAAPDPDKAKGKPE